MFYQVSKGGVNRLLGNQVVVVQNQEELFRLLRKAIDERLQDGMQWRGLLCPQVGHKLTQSPGCWLSSAVSTYIQNATGSLSPSSKDSQAICGRSDGNDWTQVESRVVLPKASRSRNQRQWAS